MRTNKHKFSIKLGFSLVEMLLLLMIASLITAGSISVITRKHTRVPKKVVHGKYTCYRTSDGKLYEERYVEKTLLYKREVTECKFDPPAKANYFYIQLVGGGGSGGDAGYNGNTRNSVHESGTTNGFGWTESDITSSPYYITLSEWRNLVAGDTVYACARSGSGGDGSDAKYVYKLTNGSCTCGGSKIGDYLTEEDCQAHATETTTCTWLAATSYYYTGGGSGGASATCKTAEVPVDLGLSQSTSNSTGSNGSSYYYWSGGSGGYGEDGENASAGINKNGSLVTSCTAYGGEGGGPATSSPDTSECAICTKITDGIDGDDGYCSGTCTSCTAGAHSPSYTWTHDYDTKYVTAGEGGTAGEYIAIFVRSFKNEQADGTSRPIDLKPGRGGAAPQLGSGNDGNPGEATSINNGQISVPGGLGGKGNIPLPVETLPPAPGYKSEAPSTSNTHTGISPNYMGSVSNYERAANVTNMNDVPASEEGIDLNTFGRGGNGGTSEDRCWIGEHIRTFKGTTLSSTFSGPLGCSDSNYTNFAATAGAPGSIVIIW